MRSKLVTYALAGTLGLSAVGVAAVAVPAVSYAATGDTAALTDRVSAIKQALAGLVTDGTLSQAEADRVADVLAEAGPLGGHGHGPGGGPGGRGAGLEAAAEALGLTVAELRTAAQEGATLAELAEQEGVREDDLVAALVAAAREHLAEGVADGRLTQEQADDRAAGAEERIRASLDEPLRAGRGGHGRHGRGGSPDEAPAPSTSPSVAPSASVQGSSA